MKKVMLDTNFLMIPAQFKVDIFSEIERVCDFNYKLCVYKGSVSELNEIVKNQPQKHRKAAELALKIIKSKKIEIIDSDESYVDSLILKNVDNDTIVATQDTNLRKELLRRKVPVIFLRQKKYLQLFRE